MFPIKKPTWIWNSTLFAKKQPLTEHSCSRWVLVVALWETLWVCFAKKGNPLDIQKHTDQTPNLRRYDWMSRDRFTLWDHPKTSQNMHSDRWKMDPFDSINLRQFFSKDFRTVGCWKTFFWNTSPKETIALPETDSKFAPEKMAALKGEIHLKQPWIFSGARNVSFRECNSSHDFGEVQMNENIWWSFWGWEVG